MTETSDGERRPKRRRVPSKVARFVAIVWGLAGAFLGLQYLESLLFETAVERGAIDADLMTPEMPENPACGHLVAALEPADLDASDLARSRRLAFDLGLDLGFEAGAYHIRLAGAEPAPHPPRDRAALAAELAVPAPEVPEVRQRANAFQEYTRYLAADPQCVAAHLAKVYSPRHAALYRLGAVVAPNVAYRRFGIASAYRTGVRRYGEAAGVPRELLEPLARKGESGDPAGVLQEAEAALERLEAWVSGAEETR